MAAKKDYQGLSPAEQRAARDARLTEQVSAVELAKAREMKMVASLGRFTEECRWFIGNKVWLTLGYETLIAWWADRITPLVDGLGLRPGPEMAQMAIEAIQEEEAALPPAQRHSKTAISRIVGVGEWKVRGRQDQRSRRTTAKVDLDRPTVIDVEPSDVTDEPQPDDLTAALTQAITETAAHTSGAVPPASTEGTSLALGEPGDSEQAAESSGTQDSPAAVTESDPIKQLASLPQPGLEPQERIEEEAVEPPADLPAAAMTSLPDGDGDPTPEPEQQPGHNSPTGLEAAQPREGRSKTDHQQDAGVSSPAGEAPEVASTDPVEPVELEGGGTAQDPPSSSHPDAPDAGELLLVTFAEFMHYLDGVDFEAVGPMLLGADLEALHSHVESITAYVGKLGRARFAEMLHTAP